jgi:hypothetical protein
MTNLTAKFSNDAYHPSLNFVFRDAGVYCHAAITLDDAIGTAVCEFDVNILRQTTNTILVETDNALKSGIAIVGSVQQATFNRLCIAETKQNARAVCIDNLAQSQQMTTSTLDILSNQANAISINQSLFTKINRTEFIFTRFCTLNSDTLKLSNRFLSVQDVLIFLAVKTNTFQAPALSLLFKHLCAKTPYSLKTSKRFCALLQQAIAPATGKSQHIDLPRPPPTPQPPEHQTITIPTRTVYTMQHTILVKTYPDNIPVSLSKISLSLDRDSYAWNFSGVLANKADLSLFVMSDFVPIKLTITINSYQWLVLVEKIPEKKSFGKTDISLQGRSLSVLLGDPWQSTNSYTAGSDMTVQQIANALIPYDWSINWQHPTWLVPANTYSYVQQTKLQALKTLTTNIGAVLIPDRATQTLIVKPNYPVLPWNYHLSGITPDLIIPDSAIESIGIESRTVSPINGVYVHGEQNGVLAFCRLNGTAGDVLAPTQSNALITDVTGARALGERILAGKATQPLTTSVTTFLGGDFPLAEIGQLVEVNNERATVNGVSVDVELGKVRQSITVGENTNNLYSKLLNLLPTPPLLVGNVVSLSGGTSILTLLGGGVITARGNGVVGQNYYVRNGYIESSAPNLDPVEIVI